jgi:aminoglycoside phosphotransferase (APT) family kinase protein
MPFVDPALMDAVDQRLQDLADADGPPDRAEAVIHGDASLSNVIVHDGRIKALLDFEWATMGRRDQDLLTVLRSLQLYRPPGMSPAGSAAFGLDCVRGTYPELLSPGIERRMWLYELAFNVRGLIVWPAYAPEAVLDPRHPARQLRALVDRPSHLAVDQAADR